MESKNKTNRLLWTGLLLIVLFVVWTYLVQTVDVQTAGESGTAVGFATFNTWFHQMTGVHLRWYTVTDWLGLVPVFICMGFAVLGLKQLIQRKSLWNVDYDILALGVYYVLVIVGYLVFEMVPINYRPILIDGRMEASYPSSTTLLVLSVMPTLVFQMKLRMKNLRVQHIISTITVLFTCGMVLGRLFSGVHWFTDIVGAVLLSGGLYVIYKAVVSWNLEKNFKN